MNILKAYKYISIIIYMLTGMVALSNAQDQEVPIVRADFTVYSLQRLQDLHYLNGDLKSSTPMTFYSSSRSTEYHYEGPNPLIFFKEIPAPTPEDPNAVSRKKVGQVTLPEAGGKLLMIFFPKRDSKEEDYSVYPLDDSTAALPYGAIRLFNATPYTLEGVLGKDRINLAPGPGKAYRVNSTKTSLGLGIRHEGKFHQSFNSPLQLLKDSRGLMMIFPPFVKGSAIVQTRFITEKKPKDASSTPTPDANAAP